MKLSDREWGVFSLTGSDGLFPIHATSTGVDAVRLKQGNVECVPYITRTETNNGIARFVSKENLDYGKDKGNCITIGLDTQTAYWQTADFITGQNIHVLRSDLLNYYSGIFLTVILRNQMKSKFNWGGNGATLGRLRKLKIMLPITDDGEPDYQFMEDYIHELMVAKRKQYRDFVEKRLTELGVDVKITGGGYKESLDSREWKAIPIVKLFKPGRGKGLNHLNLAEHGVSYIGATNRNNGVMCFVKDDIASCKMVQEGNCIGFIKNGDGSAGFAIYKKESFVSTSDVIYGYADWLNEYTGLFFVAAQDLIEKKYSHGYKRNQQHLKGDRVMLPVTETGDPDYEFMEEFGRKMMTNKYSQYLASLALSDTIKEMENRIQRDGSRDCKCGSGWGSRLRYGRFREAYSTIFLDTDQK